MTIYLPGSTVYFLISSKNCESGLLSFSSSLLLSTEHFFTLLGTGGLTVDVDVELELFFATSLRTICRRIHNLLSIVVISFVFNANQFKSDVLDIVIVTDW